MTSKIPSLDSKSADLRRAALSFVILIGVVSLFAEATYEGARSIVGPYMLVLGAFATVDGVVAGLGELVGYGLRLCQVGSAIARASTGRSRCSATPSTCWRCPF